MQLFLIYDKFQWQIVKFCYHFDITIILILKNI
jgi:hypothetical protein